MQKQPNGVRNMLLTALKPVQVLCRVKKSLSVFSAIGKSCVNHLHCLILAVCPEIVCRKMLFIGLRPSSAAATTARGSSDRPTAACTPAVRIPVAQFVVSSLFNTLPI